jgi:Zn-dependent protease with chaperone function
VAFCAGLLRPRIYVSEQTLASLGAEELRAIVAHEAHHADRRDPLRLVLAAALTAVLGVVPGFAAMRRRHALLAELAADAAAERTVGGRAPLAAALLAFDEGVRGSIAPERVDRLLGTHQPASFSPVLLAVAAAALLVTAAVAVVWALVPSHPDLPISSLAFCFAALCVIASPAWLVARRLGR